MADTHAVMNHRLALVTAFLLGTATISTIASADAPPLDVFLEQRVAEELAADGTLLSRLNVALDVDIVERRAIISLVDPATRRAVASTKLDSLPADRDAAVASVTQVAASLVAQIRGPAPAPATSDVRGALAEDRRLREQREDAEAQYRREAIRFGHLYVATTNGTSTSVGHALIPYQGDRRLDPESFFATVERPDLAERYRGRRNFGIGAVIAGSAATLVGTYFIAFRGIADFEVNPCGFDDPACDASFEAREAEREAAASRDLKIGLGISAIGLTATLVGVYYYTRANPVSESEAHDLADQHNAKVRKKYFRASPYMTTDGGGLALSGRF